jgi:hypothetical protein
MRARLQHGVDIRQAFLWNNLHNSVLWHSERMLNMPARSRLYHFTTGLAELEQLWGWAALGAALSDAYFSGHWLTVDSLQSRLSTSGDRIRRGLSKLEAQKRIEKQVERGRASYRASAEYAERSVSILNRSCGF